MSTKFPIKKFEKVNHVSKPPNTSIFHEHFTFYKEKLTKADQFIANFPTSKAAKNKNLSFQLKIPSLSTAFLKGEDIGISRRRILLAMKNGPRKDGRA